VGLSCYFSTVLRNPIYDYEDFEILLVQFIDPRILVVKKESPYNSLEDIVDAIGKKPGKIAIGCSAGGNQHLILLTLRDKLNLDFKIVGYKGGSAARAAMLGGHVDGAMGETSGAYYLRDQTKAIILFDDKYNDLWPEAIPYTEQLKPYGVEMPDLATYCIYMVRKEVKQKYPDRFNRLKEAFLAASKDPKYLELADKAGFTPVLVWEDAIKYKDSFQEQLKLFKETKHLWQE